MKGKDTDRAAAQSEGSGCVHLKLSSCPRCQVRLAGVTRAMARLQEDAGILGPTPTVRTLSTAGLAGRLKTEEEGVTSVHSTGEDTTKIPQPDVLKSWRRPGETERQLCLRGTTDSYHLQSLAATSFLPLQTRKKAGTGLTPAAYRRYF